MNRRGFLALVIPVVATACIGTGSGVSTPHPTQGVQRRFDLNGGENLRAFMKRNRDRRRDAAKKRRERRARARRRRRNRGF